MARKKADPVAEKERAEQDENRRCYLYSADCPEGKIFKGADAIAAAEKDGWQDTPPADEPATSGGGKGKK
jgi:hypothetical protein